MSASLTLMFSTISNRDAWTHNQLIKVGGNETQFRSYEFEKASLTCERLRDVEMDFFFDQPYILVSSLW